MLAEWLLDVPAVAFIGSCVAIGAELFSVGAAFRSPLLRSWYLVLIGFHLMTQLTMGILFVPAAGTLIALVLFSPFPPDTALGSEAERKLQSDA